MAAKYVILVVLALTAHVAISSWNNLNCPAPRAPDNGLSFIFRNGELVHFRCHPGYQMRGTPVAYCVKNVWTNSAPECIPIRKWPHQYNSTVPHESHHDQWKTEKQRQLFNWGDETSTVYGDGPRRLPLINGIWPSQEQVLALGPQSTPGPKILVKEEIDIAELRHRQLEELKKQRFKADERRRRQGQKKNKKNSVLDAPRETVLSLGATEDGEAFSIAFAKPTNGTDKVHTKHHKERHHRRPRKRQNFNKKYYRVHPGYSNFVTSRKSRVNTSGISPYHTMYQFNSNSKNDVAELRRRPVQEIRRKSTGYDTSCVESIYRREVPMIAPQIPNGFVYRYETKKNKRYPFNNYMEVKYKCLSGFVFATNAQTLYCKEASWVGEVPRCIATKV
ncbi:uncharacterized protein LOC129959515 isoform X2 [Argiope bruennichi]|uniref:uncharacterized protein LOC129959515 isoform X2 n=1 Tax=Argiope bruennichi TaxID=94029 RepID=UPI002493D4B8|nr:uncharacterized protein LOC129959515 isoform X2 [Argiope bruennichi]